MGYCTYITKAGYALQAKLFAEGGDFSITRVEVGSGVCPEGADPSTFSRLIATKARATSTKPRREGCEVALTVEYRSDLNGGIEKPFQISEFGVFSIGAEGQEILLLYGDLSDYPETAVPQKYGGCVRRYPINVIIGPDAKASLAYPAGAWATWEEMDDAIRTALDGLRTELEGSRGASGWYHTFEVRDWTGNQLRIPQEVHGMDPKQPACLCTLRCRQGNGQYAVTWGSQGSHVYWDLTAKTLVVSSAAPFAGDLLVMDCADSGPSASGPSGSGSASASVDWANIRNKPDVALKSDLSSVYRYKGSAASLTALPRSGNATGDVWNAEDTGMNYAWDGTKWDPLGEAFEIQSITNAEIDTMTAQ